MSIISNITVTLVSVRKNRKDRAFVDKRKNRTDRQGKSAHERRRGKLGSWRTPTPTSGEKNECGMNGFTHSADYCPTVMTYQAQSGFFQNGNHEVTSGSLSVFSSSSTAETLYFSSAHAPKSICLHRSEQNGRYRFASFHSTSLPQTGHFTIVTIL